MQLAFDAVASGILLGGFYAVMALGVTIAFGMLDITNIAHPAIIVLAAFLVFWTSQSGWDPLLSMLVLTPVFFFGGRLLFKAYHFAFERHGDDAMRGLAFFFGLMFVTEIALALTFGVDIRALQVGYTTGVLKVAGLVLPWRMVVAFSISAVLFVMAWLYMNRTFTGRAIVAGAQNPAALRLMGIDPVRIREIAFGLSAVTAAVAGALLLLVQPVEPATGREFIGRVFAICVLGGLGSLTGTFVIGVLIGIVESLVATFWGPSWAPAAAFGILLATLALRPSGMFSR